MSYIKQKAFTLVELIVVVTILAILATIGFVSYSSYLTGVRDTNRLAQLVSIHDGLELYRTKKDLPLPDDNVEVIIGSDPIAYQGYAGSNTLETIDFSKGGKDPRDGEYFSYYLTDDRKYFQLMAFLEEEANTTSYTTPHPNPLLPGEGIIKSIQAADYSNRIPTIYGKKLGILTDIFNKPIQEIQAIKDNGSLTLTSGNVEYVAYLSDSEILKTSNILSINPEASCKRIKQLKGGSSDGVYTINPTGIAEFKVYCDMTTDGGGWTYATMLAGTSPRNLFNSGNTDKIESITENIYTKGTLSDIWNDTNSKDIMLVCNTESSIVESYKKPMIIYSYLKADINNLEKLAKAGSSFASVNLLAKYNGKKFTLGLLYAASGNNNSHYITDSDNRIAFALGSGGAMNVNPDSGVWGVKGPSYRSSSGTAQGLDITNYCMTAIR